jgi:hypothetical protein
VTQFGDEAGATEHPDGPGLGYVDDDGVTGFAPEDEGHEAVGTGIGVLELAVVATDRDRRSR